MDTNNGRMTYEVTEWQTFSYTVIVADISATKTSTIARPACHGRKKNEINGF